VVDAEFLRGLFPRPEEVPLEHRPPALVHQRRVLINGELRSYEGPCRSVMSPIRVRNSAGALEQVELGSYREGSEIEADDALAAALSAYDNGRFLVFGAGFSVHGHDERPVAERKYVLLEVLGDECGDFLDAVVSHQERAQADRASRLSGIHWAL
jgi:hypothetical protein